MSPQAIRRLKALIPPEGVHIDAARAERIFNATPADWPDAERVLYTKAVMRMVEEPRVGCKAAV